MVWHPDRFPSDEGKKDAEEELKKINNAKDLLWKHFESSDHRASGCECQQPIGSQQTGGGPQAGPGAHQQQHGPGPGRDRTKGSDAEEQARQRDARRKAQAAAEEASRQAAQEEQKKQGQQFEQAQKQQASYEDEKLRWKVAQGLGAVFLVLCLFAWIGGGIRAAISSISKTISQNNTNNTTENKNDPCLLSGPQRSPPAVILPTLIDGVKEKVSLWDIKCDRTNGGATVHGRDAGNHDVVWQVYGPNWILDHQDLVKGQGNEIVVDRYKMPGDYQGRCIYRFENDSMVEAVQLDSKQNTVMTASVERRRNGRVASVTVKPIGGNTTTYYDLSGTDVKTRFYQGERYMVIRDYVEPPNALISPEAAPTPTPAPDSGSGTNGPNPFRTGLEKLKQ